MKFKITHRFYSYSRHDENNIRTDGPLNEEFVLYVAEHDSLDGKSGWVWIGAFTSRDAAAKAASRVKALKEADQEFNL